MNAKSEVAVHSRPDSALSSSTGRSSKLQSSHLEGAAIVYVRQSTTQQVLNHQESAERQYALVDRAVQLGWPRDRVEVIDEDQGHSGASIEGRNGFKRLLTEVSLDHVGIILGIEMSRFARSNKDWHQLIELCAIFGTLLADQDGLYDPTDYNDRLLLGLRGIMNEAELHILKGRMFQALLSKAKRGEVYVRPPMGYVKLPTGKFAIDPDEQVQNVVRMIFEEFGRRGSIRSVLRFLQQNDIKLPIRPHTGPNKGELQWETATPSVVNNVLTHELYAGMYRYGHNQTDPRRKKPGQPNSGRVDVAPENYHALIPNHCPAYVTEEQYQRNQKRIRNNRFGARLKGAPRNGPSLLAGILYCGRCGRSMSVCYPGRSHMRYQCTTGYIDFREPKCQNLSGEELDELVAEKVLKAMEPASLEVSIAAAADLENEQRRLDENWRQRIERANFEVDRSRRQYQLVEPDNRLVARELERDWENALQAAKEVDTEYARFKQTHSTSLSSTQRKLIQSLSTNLPCLWHASTTSNEDRKRIIRLLIDRVNIAIQGTTEQVDVTIFWSGGFTSRHELVRSVRKYEQTADFSQLKTRIIELKSSGMTYGAIATQLNDGGFRTSRTSDGFNKSIVGNLVKKICPELTVNRSTNKIQLRKHEWTIKALSKHLGIPRTTLDSWRIRGWLRVSRKLPGYHGRIVFWANESELDRLRRLRISKWHYGDPPRSHELTTPQVEACDEN